MASRPEWVHLPLQRKLGLAELADRHRDRKTLLQLQAAEIGQNPVLAESIRKRLTIDATRRLIEGLKFSAPRMEDLALHADPEASLVLGEARDSGITVLYAVRLARQHLLILGATGEGKTSFLYALVVQFVQFGSVWVFEGGAKTDFRHLTQLLPDLLVLDPETMAFNPWQVHEGQHPRRVLTMAEEMFAMTNWLRDGSRAMLRKAGHSLFAERGIFAGGDDFPTLIDIRHRVASLKVPGYSRSAAYKDSALNRKDGFLSEAPKLYTYRKGFDIADLARRSFVYELQDLSPPHAAFQFYSLISTLIDHRIANGKRGDAAWPVMVVVDEAKWIAPPRNELGFSPLEYLLAQARELGVSFVFADQSTELNPALFTQCRLLAAFRLGGGANIEAVRKAFGLTKEQADHLHKLQVGEAVVRLPRIDPFILRTPHFRTE